MTIFIINKIKIIYRIDNLRKFDRTGIESTVSDPILRENSATFSPS